MKQFLNVVLFSYLALGSSIWAENKAEVNFHNNNMINTHPTSRDCSLYFGETFMQCMECQAPENLKKIFTTINSRQAVYFYKNLNENKKIEFLNHFTQEEWNEWRLKLDASCQNEFPKHKDELTAGRLFGSVVLITTASIYALFKIFS